MIKNNTFNWNQLASDIENAVDGGWKEFKDLSEEFTLFRPEPSEWSAKEIMGHLIDSATNNHQRFIRLQIVDHLHFPDYSKDNHAWVSIQKYKETPWVALIELWRHFNLHLARIIRNVNEKCINHTWIIDEKTSIKLGDLMIDYLRHLNDHLQQIRKQINGSNAQ